MSIKPLAFACSLLIALPAAAFEQHHLDWTLQATDGGSVILLNQLTFKPSGSVGMACITGDRALTVGPLEDSGDTALITYSCDGGAPSAIIHASRNGQIFVASKENNASTWAAVVAFPEALLSAKNQCSVVIGNHVFNLSLNGIKTAVPSFYAACSARGY